MKILIRTHYWTIDQDCTSDYTQVEVFVDGALVKDYGDGYHDKGRDKAESFVEGMEYVYCGCQGDGYEFIIEREEVADYVS